MIFESRAKFLGDISVSEHIQCFHFERKMIRLKFCQISLRSYSSSQLTLREILIKKQPNQEVTVKGWIKNARSMKETVFVDINDGTTGENLQIVCNKSDKHKLGYGASIEATGTTALTPKGQLELKVKDMQLHGACPLDENFPYAARHSYPPEYIRQHLHLRSRVGSFNSMMRCRHNLMHAINSYLHREGFILVNTPILTCKSPNQNIRFPN